MEPRSALEGLLGMHYARGKSLSELSLMQLKKKPLWILPCACAARN
jgi:hypothetical protein